MEKNKRIIIANKKGYTLYENDGVAVYNDNGLLFFESSNPILGEMYESYDCAESVAALMRVESIFHDENFWKIKIKNSKYDIIPGNSLYWLTGGTKEWSINDTYSHKWSEVYSIYEHRYSDIIFNIVENAESLGDIKNDFIDQLNLLDLYEFSLNNNLIK